MMKNYLLFIFSVLCFSVYAQPGFTWAKQMGGADYCSGGGMVLDGSGNIYTVGQFTDTADFNPSSAVYNLISHSSGYYDIFVSKWDNDGNFLWAKSMGGTDQDYGIAIAIDKNRNIYITGKFSGTADFDPGAGIYNLTSAGGEDIYVCKLDSLGNFIWAKRMGGPGSNYECGISIATDNNHNVCLTGIFSSTSDFDPGTGVYNLVSVGTATDIFICKLDSSGNFIWAKQLGGMGQDISSCITTDTSNNIYVTGHADNVFVCKLDALGNFIWTKILSVGDASSVVIDKNSNMYVGGFGFASKYDVFGNLIWIKNVPVDGCFIAVDNYGNVLCNGAFSGTCDFDPGPGVYNLTAIGPPYSIDMSVSELDSSGNFICAGKMGGFGNDGGSSIAVDNNGNVYALGSFAEIADLNPGTGINNFYANAWNAFITKFPNCAINVGENEIAGNNSSLVIFPNPTNNIFYINYSSTEIVNDLQLEIKNVLGETIYSKNYRTGGRQLKDQIDLSKQAKGIYFIEIIAEGKKSVEKVILN